MLSDQQRFDDASQLEKYIYKTLCEQGQLQQGAFPMNRRVLNRNGKPCAVYFCIHGPRATRFTAIWEIERNRVLFYDCDGGRFAQTIVDFRRRHELAAA